MLIKRLTAAATMAVVLGVFAMGSASAQQNTWNFDNAAAPTECQQNTGTGSNNGTYGNSYGCAVAGTTAPQTLQASAFSQASGANFATAFIGQYGGGFGVSNRNEGLTATDPQHTMDNDGGKDVLLLNFTSGPIALNTIQLGFVSNTTPASGDADISVLRWTRSGGPTVTGSSVATLVTDGWEVVANIGGAGTSAWSFNTGTGVVSSSYWLVSAYDGAFATARQTLGAGLNAAPADYVKLISVGGVYAAQTPEPATLALAAFALAGIAASRRRR